MFSIVFPWFSLPPFVLSMCARCLFVPFAFFSMLSSSRPYGHLQTRRPHPARERERKRDVDRRSLWRANYFRFFLIRFRNYFWIPASLLFLLLCFPAFPAFPASLLLCFLLFCFAFLLLLLLCFSAFLLFCFSCFSASLLFCFFAFLFFLFLCFSAFPAFPASLLFCFSCFFAFLLFCFCAFPVSLLLCFFASVFFFALPALNTWFSCKMHFAQYLHPWVSHDQPSLEN